MRLDSLLIGIAIFGMFATAGIIFMFGQGQENGYFTNYYANISDTNFNDMNSKVRDVYNISDEIKTDLMEQDITTTSNWESLTIGAYKTFKTMTGSFRLVGEIINNISLTIGINSIFSKFAMIILSISILFAMIYMLFRINPSG